MAKTLAVLGIAGAVMAALALLVLANLALLLVPLFAIGAAIFVMREANPMAKAIGIVTILLSIIAVLGLIGSVSLKGGGGTSFGISVDVGVALAVLAALMIPVAVSLLRRDEIEPEWLAMAGLGAAALCVILAFVGLNGITNHATGLTLTAGILALVAISPSIGLLRSDGISRSENRPNAKTDPLAIVALVLGIFGVSVVAIALGITSLYRIKEDENLRGKGKAEAGIILGAIWLLVSIAVVLTVFGNK